MTFAKGLKRKVICLLFLTAYDDEVNVIMGFELGADDYISKPFRVKELMLRIKSVMRRYSNETSDGIIKINNLKINTNEAKVYKNNEEIILTAMEYRLLLILLSNRERCFHVLRFLKIFGMWQAILLRITH